MTDQMDEIHGFSSPLAFESFRTSIEGEVRNGTISEVPVEQPYGASNLFDERWFVTASGEKWRLVAPEPPFRGVFERVS